MDVLQTARVLAREDVLHYNLLLDTLGDYYVVLYFTGILPVSASFDILINGDVQQSEFTIRTSEASTLYLTLKGITSLGIALRRIRFYPQINAFEVYEIVDIPPEASSTTGGSFLHKSDEFFLLTNADSILHDFQFQHFKLLSSLPVSILGGKMILASQLHGIVLNVKEV